MAEKVNWDTLKENWIIVDHELHGVTPEMIDWWKVNMEKGYPLWEPDEHKGFEWIVPPPKEHPTWGSEHYAIESIGGGQVHKVHLMRIDPNTLPEPIKETLRYEHCSATMNRDDKGNVRSYLTHQWEATSYGTKYRVISYPMQPRPAAAGEAWRRHNISEVGRYPEFLPILYRLWQVVKDPEINRQANFENVLKR